jgi:hypothetical protein
MCADPTLGWNVPDGWQWSCGEVGWVCSQPCAFIASKYGLRRGNHRPDDDYLLMRREETPEESRMWNLPRRADGSLRWDGQQVVDE